MATTSSTHFLNIDFDSNSPLHSFADPEKQASSKDPSTDASTLDLDAHWGKLRSDGECAKATVDPNIVDWDGRDDPENPINFSNLTKFTNIGIVSSLAFLTPLASAMFAPGVPEIMEEFGSSNTLLASFVVSVYVLGFAVGPLILAPMSEMTGRTNIYHACNFGFMAFTIACAVSTDMGMLIACRFFQGCFGSAPMTNGGGTIADLVVQEKRGAALILYTLGIFLGPAVGPVAGGYLVAAKGWRWVFWVLTMMGGALTIICLLFMSETYPAVLLKRKTDRLTKETGNTSLRSKYDQGLRTQQLFIQAITRPCKLLLFSPIVSSTSVFTGILYGYQYLMLSTFTFVFEDQYAIPTKSAGLTFLGFGAGSVLGLFVIGSLSDRIVKARSKPTPSSPSGVMKPEHRLPPLAVGMFFIPAGLFMYGWAAEYKTHWIVPIIGTALVGVGIVSVFMCMTSYLIDAFGIYAASAVAANTVVRSFMGALLPLAGQSMYGALGLGWGNSLLGFIAVGCIPVPWVIMKYGERLRVRFEVKL
ncbi:major facilitator superfamily domain-containing protein [Aspergillus varians]